MTHQTIDNEATVELKKILKLATMNTLFQTANPETNLKGEKCVTFSLRGNGVFGNVTRTGWKASKLSYGKTCIIMEALEDVNVDKVYRRGGKYYKFLLNGTEVRILN